MRPSRATRTRTFCPMFTRARTTERRGANITGDLPEFGPVRVIVEHPRNPNLLFVGTEFCAFVSITGGGQWVPLKEALADGAGA